MFLGAKDVWSIVLAEVPPCMLFRFIVDAVLDVRDEISFR